MHGVIQLWDLKNAPLLIRGTARIFTPWNMPVSRHLLGALGALGATFVLSTATANAAPAHPVDRDQRQPDGSIVTLPR
jgi:hypothetical protein